MNAKIENKLALISKKYRLDMTWQHVRFGYKRAVINCTSHEEFTAVLGLLRRYKGLYVDFWTCYEGEFEGKVFVMDSKDHDEMQALAEKESARVEEWWMRYHLADAETRRLMACGAIE